MADFVGPLVEIVKCFATPTCEYVGHYKNFDDDVNRLRDQLEAINRRKRDLRYTIAAEVRSGGKVKEEVRHWIRRVPNINKDVQAILGRADRVKWYRKARLGKHICRKLEEVEGIYNRGSFTGRLVLRKVRARGIIISRVKIPTEQIEGEISTKDEIWKPLMDDEVGMIGVCSTKDEIWKPLMDDEVGMIGDCSTKDEIWKPLMDDEVGMIGVCSTKDEIWKHLMDDEVGMIGVCGIGGVGKTTIVMHINNALLREGRFQKVIWVVVSFPLKLFELQKKIADAMCESLQEVEEMRRAAELMDLMGKVSFVLILDDVWEKFSLKDVGIPEPVQNKSKVVITSRSVEVCNYLNCKIVKVQPLSSQESLSLFLDKVGRDVLQKVSGLEETLKLIVEECKGLPLAIVVIAGSLKGEYDIEEWENALNELRQCVRSVKCVEDEIFGLLRLSYDHLRSLLIQECFLYCSLFGEGYEFLEKKLIEDWIDEGLIDELGSRQAAYDRGHAILNKLQRNCLLEKIVDWRGDVFRMHDVVRDMAIKSIGLGCGYMVKAGMKLKKVPKESEWVGDLKKVSLMANDISKIPVGLSPKCLLLSTLILSKNPNLLEIPSSFFEGMVALKVLDLSGTGIEALPDSISNLVNLSALRLRECRSLKYLPSLAKLTTLKKLDLYWAGIEMVPEGMEMLVSLEYLDLNCPNLKEIPTGILASLSSLQYLVVYPSSAITKRIHIEEVARLSNLESLECGMEFQGFNYLVNKSKDLDCLTAYEFRLTTGEQEVTGYGFSDEYQRKVLIANWEIGEECVMLPNTLMDLWISCCKNMKNMRCSLNKTVLLENATELRSCKIDDFEGIECIVELDSSSSLCCPVLDKLEDLNLEDLNNLSALVRVEGVATPPRIFSNLKSLLIRFCSAMRNLVPLKLLQALQNLVCIQVRGCKQMEEIIASSDSDASSLDKFTFTFSKLRMLILVELDQLKSICGGNEVMVCDSIEEIQIIKCPKLKRIPLQLPLLDNGQPSPPPCLKKIGIDEESEDWWESVVEWDHPNAKNILQSFLEFTPFREWGMW